MLKQLILLFIFLFSIDLFAESRYIHKEISDIKLNIQKIKLLNDREIIEKRIYKLENKINQVTQNIAVNQNTLLKNIDKKLNESKWSPSDKATVVIAFFTFFSIMIALFALNAQLKALKEQNITQKNQLEINQLENQIFKQISFLDNMLMKREFNMELVDYLMKKLNFDKQEIIEDKIKIYKDPRPNIEFYKGNFNTYINFLKNHIHKLNENLEVKEILSEVTSLDSDMNLFAYKLKSLKQLLDKSIELGYDNLLIQVSFDVYYSYAENLYKYGKIDKDVFNYYTERIDANNRNL